MNREAIFHQLSNADRVQELCLRMKRLPSDSPAFICLDQWMTQINAFRPLRGIDKKHVIQNIVSFTSLRRTWLSHRLVCKSWRHAIESMRFNASIEDLTPMGNDDEEGCFEIDNAVKFVGAHSLLTRLTKLYMYALLDAEGERVLLNSMRNMKEMRLHFWGGGRPCKG